MKLYREVEIVERIEGLTHERLERLVARGWVECRGQDERGVRLYEEIDAARIRLIHELEGEFGVNEEGVEIILDLLDQLHGLRRRVRRLIEAAEALEPSLRDELIRGLRDAAKE